jgi:hypothetical protein
MVIAYNESIFPKVQAAILPIIDQLKYRIYEKRVTDAGEIEVGSFLFKRKVWKRERRIVVIQWKEEVDRAQLSLFDALGYTYAVFVTNLPWNEEDIYRFYDKRADVENHIREAKYEVEIGHISTGDFHANAADLELRLLALNQLILFAKKILKHNSPRPLKIPAKFGISNSSVIKPLFMSRNCLKQIQIIQ